MTTAFIDKPFGSALAELGERCAQLVVLDADLQRATETDLFQSRFPERHFNLGVAEANMVCLAAGLALSGKTVVCGTFACFISQRVCDQVVISVAHCNADVKLIGVEAGLSSGGNGATHQGMLDLAILRAVPNMSVFVAGDATETRAILAYAVTHPGPAYLRVPRRRAPVLIDPAGYAFQPGRSIRLRPGNDVTLITCGMMLPRCLKAAEALQQDGIAARVVNMSSIKPLDEAEVRLAAEETGAIVVAENHSILGGLGGAVAEVVAEVCPVPVLRIGVCDRFGEVGPVDWLAEQFEMAPTHIAGAASDSDEGPAAFTAAASCGLTPLLERGPDRDAVYVSGPPGRSRFSSAIQDRTSSKPHWRYSGYATGLRCGLVCSSASR